MMITHFRSAFFVSAFFAFSVLSVPTVGAQGADSAKASASEPLFGLGVPNDMLAKYFIGKSYLKPLNMKEAGVFNVTFEPGCRNNWHIHYAGGQILLCTDGEGWYQEEGQEPRKLLPGDVVYIGPGINHWHGAAKDSWFSHVSIAVPVPGGKTEWLGPVTDEYYLSLGEGK